MDGKMFEISPVKYAPHFTGQAKLKAQRIWGNILSNFCTATYYCIFTNLNIFFTNGIAAEKCTCTDFNATVDYCIC